MVKIYKANKSDNLEAEWDRLNIAHYGKEIHWQEKKYRFKAVEDDELVGTIEGKLEGDILYIAALMIKENTRGKGIGTSLIKQAEAFGKKHGARKTWLLTGKGWPANTFYTKLGFEVSGYLPDFFFQTDFVIYTREIK